MPPLPARGAPAVPLPAAFRPPRVHRVAAVVVLLILLALLLLVALLLT